MIELPSDVAHPLTIDHDLVDRMLGQLERDYLVAGYNDTKTRQLMNVTSQNRRWLVPDMSAHFEACEIYVLPYKPCLAFSQIGEERQVGQVVISEGMIDLIGAAIFDAWLQNLIPAELVEHPVGRLRQPLMVVFNAATTLLKYRFYRYGEPLPAFSAPLGEEARQNSAVALSGALTFLLLHELGHIVLGHLDDTPPRLTYCDMAYVQDLSGYQLQEVEADQFALESLKPEVRMLGPYWMSQCLAYFVKFELISGIADEGHPLAINRIHMAEQRRVQDGTQAESETIGKVLGSRFGEIQRLGPPGKDRPLLETPRKDILLALGEVVRVLRDEANVDLSALLAA